MSKLDPIDNKLKFIISMRTFAIFALLSILFVSHVNSDLLVSDILLKDPIEDGIKLLQGFIEGVVV